MYFLLELWSIVALLLATLLAGLAGRQAIAIGSAYFNITHRKIMIVASSLTAHYTRPTVRNKYNNIRPARGS